MAAYWERNESNKGTKERKCRTGLFSYSENIFQIVEMYYLCINGNNISQGDQGICVKYPNLLPALERWYKIVSNSDWKGFSDIKKQFNSVDAVGNGLFIFNIKGNDCRLIARIIFGTRTVFIRFIGTHKQYDLLDISKL